MLEFQMVDEAFMLLLDTSIANSFKLNLAFVPLGNPRVFTTFYKDFLPRICSKIELSMVGLLT